MEADTGGLIDQGEPVRMDSDAINHIDMAKHIRLI